MGKSVLILILGVYSWGASAYQDITCWDGDCLTHGWTKKNETTGQFTDHQCYRDGCRQSGWIVGGTQPDRYYTQCKPGGCFKEGWYEVDRDTQTLLATVVCNHGGCLKQGWVTYRSVNQIPTQCIKGSCETEGWVTQSPNGNTFATCKSKSCFTVGWIE